MVLLFTPAVPLLMPSAALAASYDSTVLGDGPLSYWETAEASGTTAHDAASTNNGTYTGGFTLAQARPAGIGNAAVLFNGSSGYVAVPEATNEHLGDGPLSLEAWVKTSSTANQQIISAGTGGYALRTGQSGTQPAGGLEFLSTNTSNIASSTNWISDGQWRYVVATKNGTAVHLYVDGADVTTITRPTTLTSPTSGLNIGRKDADGSTGYFNGDIAKPAFYNKVLTAAQVTAHYNRGDHPGPAAREYRTAHDLGHRAARQTLAATTGSWTNSPTSYAYQWHDCFTSCSNISGATASTYTLTSSDVGYTVDAVVTATNSGGSGQSASASTAVVTALPPSNTALPTISSPGGEQPEVGLTLTATTGSWTNSPTSYAYRWQHCSRSCSNISGATSSSYVVQSSDVGDTVDVVVTATNAGGSTPAPRRGPQ